MLCTVREEKVSKEERRRKTCSRKYWSGTENLWNLEKLKVRKFVMITG
jgi:hypothetical protein